MGLAVSCPRCGGEVRPPSLLHSDWRCDACGSVEPFYVAATVGPEVLAALCERVREMARDESPAPVWCPWPLPPGWTVTGVGWAGDTRSGPRATAVALSGPAPLQDGPADVVFVAEGLGVGLGNGLGGIAGPDPGPALAEAARASRPHAKVKVAGHPSPLWAVPGPPDRSVYIGEARAMWLYAIAWPAAAGYVLADEIELHDLVESQPSELVYGARSRRLRPGAAVE